MVEELTELELSAMEELLDTAVELRELDVVAELELELDLDFPSPPHPVINSKTVEAIIP